MSGVVNIGVVNIRVVNVAQSLLVAPVLKPMFF